MQACSVKKSRLHVKKNQRGQIVTEHPVCASTRMSADLSQLVWFPSVLEVTMLRIRSFLIPAVAAAVLALLSATSARADTWNQLTYFTFSAPVEIPGVALPAGTYMFKLADTEESRNVIQVFNKDGSKVYATFLAIPDERMTPADKPVVTFEETPVGTPEAIKAWFYPGDTIGHEFVYPKDQAQRIAAATHQPILSSASVQSNQHPTPSTNVKPAESIRNASVSRVNGRGETQPMHSETSAHTATMKSLQAANTSAAPAAQQTTTNAARSTHASRSAKQLPKTASPLPMIGLFGLAALTLGVGARSLRKRILP